MIEVLNLTKSFGAITALRNITFRAPDGAITGLLGANGAGKSTTLRTICGVLRPSGGSVQVDGLPPGDTLELQRHVGGLLDHAGLYGRLTVRETLVYSGRLHGIPESRLHGRVDEVLTLLGMQAIAERRTAGFSQGERMKVALGRAIIHAPRNLVLDEPANGLDVPSVRSLRALLRHMRDSGACILLSSHMLDEVQTVCDRVVMVAGGCVVAEGEPDQLCRTAGVATLEDAFLAYTEVA